MEATQVADSSFGKKRGAAGRTRQSGSKVQHRQGLLAWENQETAWGESLFLLRSRLASLSVSDLGGIILRKVRVMARTHSLITYLESLRL